MLPDSGHTALLEEGVDLAAIMARSGLLTAYADNRDEAEMRRSTRASRRQKDARPQVAAGAAQYPSLAAEPAASVLKGNGNRAGVIRSNGAYAAHTAALNENGAASNGAGHVVTVAAPTVNASTASNGAMLSTASVFANGYSGNGSNGSSGSGLGTVTPPASAQLDLSVEPPLGSRSMSLNGSGSVSVNGSSSISLDDVSSGRADRNLEVLTEWAAERVPVLSASGSWDSHNGPRPGLNGASAADGVPSNGRLFGSAATAERASAAPQSALSESYSGAAANGNGADISEAAANAVAAGGLATESGVQAQNSSERLALGARVCLHSRSCYPLFLSNANLYSNPMITQ